MIYERDLDESIARYQGEVHPSITTCIKLAACYALKHEMFGKPEQSAQAYSYAAGPEDQSESIIDYKSDTDFSHVVDGRKAADIWPVMDELMSTLQVVQPRLYHVVMRKLQD